MTLRWFILLSLVCLLAACAQPPRQKLDAAEYLVPRAYSLGAMTHAPIEYQAAATALADAHAAMQVHDYSEADEALGFALQHARRAIARTTEAKHRLAAEEEARRQAEADRQAAAEAAERAREKAARLARAQQASEVDQPTKPSAPPAPAATYRVGEGETLWTIAGQAVVYGDSLLWPLLYQANRDQIKDPRQIFPGQTLNIRRDMTPEELESARQKARESDIFPVARNGS